MDTSYLDQKTKEILTFMNTAVPEDIDHKKKFIKLILEAVWLSGKIEGVQSAREIFRE